ncbi:hypothetical protein [Streptomyces sp. NBC_01462]|uniref:hypothetical protein n=1 Tax=Streptomyces sp. NBC_01462 TaxID=2903876 RepID=UPI002E34785B|nr:hypothetical protein [Streptomyces sp. NBC_01462]
MTSTTQHEEVRRIYIRCRLGKSELNRLFSLASEGTTAASIAVSTQRDSSRYSAGTLTDLVDHVQSSTASGNLDLWDNLTFEASDNTGGRKVSIKLDTERAEVQVAGLDATWVHGQAARVELFLKGTGGEPMKNAEANQGSGPPFLGFLGGVLVSVLLGFFLAEPRAVKNNGSPDNPLAKVPSVLTSPAMLAILVGIGFWIVAQANRAVLRPMEEIPHGSWWSRAANADRIALCGLIVGVLSLLVTFATLGKDHF